MNARKKRAAIISRASFFIIVCLWLSVAGAPRADATGLVTDMLVKIDMPSGADYVVVDVLDGVEARYRTMAYNDIYGEYSCAGYPKAYYQAVYGVTVQNLMDTGPPHPEELFMQVETPQKGDLIFYPSPPSRNNHSAIVKAFDGERIILIEQDYKWAQADGTYTTVNRTIPYPPDASNPYEIWRLVFVQDEAEYETVVMPHPADAPPGPPAATDPETVPVFQAEVPSLLYESVVTIGRFAVTVNGEEIPVDAPALIDNDRTVMPVRWVGYALGLSQEDLFWDEPSRTVTVFNGDDIVWFTVDSDYLFINGEPLYMDCPATLIDSRAYLPVKYLAEALGVAYKWNPETASVTFFKWA